MSQEDLTNMDVWENAESEYMQQSVCDNFQSATRLSDCQNLLGEGEASLAWNA